jgi:hypothetical protein
MNALRPFWRPFFPADEGGEDYSYGTEELEEAFRFGHLDTVLEEIQAGLEAAVGL